jgi:hypothetical protein
MDKNCPICLGVGCVCENHPDLPWDKELGCECGAGMRSEQALNKKTARFGVPYSFLCLARWPFIAVELSSF